MGEYIIRRLMQAVLVLFILSSLVFFAVRLLPGDPVLMYVGPEGLQTLTVEELQAIRAEFGLDKPLMVQYGTWLYSAFHGDFGISVMYSHVAIASLIAKRLPITLHLGVMALLSSSLLGILAGVISALRWGRPIDFVVTTFANLGIAIPVFWLGILLIYLFGLELKWLPVCGYTSPFESFWLSTKQIIMPVICLGVFTLAATARQTRSSMLEVIRQDYIRTAWAKGLSERTVVIRHALKNGLAPVITLIGMQTRMVIGGAVLIETVFNIPGMGRLLVDGVLSRDYLVVQSSILVVAVAVMMSNLVVDLSYVWFDPRVRFD